MMSDKQRKAAKEIERCGHFPTYIDGRTRRSMFVRGLVQGYWQPENNCTGGTYLYRLTDAGKRELTL